MIHSSRELFGARKDAVYDVLRQLEPGLIVDVGAAAGMLTTIMLARSPRSRVIAIEPFPGNHPFLAEVAEGDDRVTVVHAAVADTTAPSTFRVGRTVQGTEPGWERYVGYSSLGYVVEPDYDGPDATITVPTVRIDDLVGDEHVRFMKVDVQGGELGVLKSARRAIAEGRIDVMFIEFSGELDLLEHIASSGFDVFDSEYQLMPKDGADLSDWAIIREGWLSTGRPSYWAWPIDMPETITGYAAMFTERRPKLGSFQTDLVCVRQGFVDRYLRAATRAMLSLDPP